MSVSGHEWGVRNLGLSEGWHHIAVTYPRGKSDSFLIYVDGVLQESRTLSGTVRTVNTGSSVAYIGRSAGGSSDYYGGAIDDLRVYNYQLSAAEVTTLAVPDSYEITSPDGSLVVTVTSSSGSLAYAVSRNGNELIADSPLAIRKGEDHTVTGAAITSHDSTWEPTWGLYEQIRDHHNRLTLTLDVGGIEFDLIFKVFDDGLGFRFAAAEQAALSGRVLDFNVNYDLDDNFEAWWPRGEHSPEGPHTLNNLPSNPNWVVVIDAGTSGFFALLESDLYPAEAFGPIKFQRVSGQSLVRSNMQSVPVPAGDFITPWRTVLVGDEVGDLLESTVSVNVAAPLALDDTSWIKPGKAFFNWRTLDYEADDGFTYKVDTATLKRLIDHAVDLGIDYVQIDDEWWTLIDDGGETIDQKNNFDIDEIMEYAASRGVNMTVYVDRLPSQRIQNTTDEQLYQLFADKGAAAIKYGFRGPNAPFTREAIRSLADKEMVINFHDGPVPLTGAPPHDAQRHHPPDRLGPAGRSENVPADRLPGDGLHQRPAGAVRHDQRRLRHLRNAGPPPWRRPHPHHHRLRERARLHDVLRHGHAPRRARGVHREGRHVRVHPEDADHLGRYPHPARGPARVHNHRPPLRRGVVRLLGDQRDRPDVEHRHGLPGLRHDLRRDLLRGRSRRPDKPHPLHRQRRDLPGPRRQPDLYRQRRRHHGRRRRPLHVDQPQAA